MSAIDAAIIKALVEHIGGNPDSVPDGTIGGGDGASYTAGEGITISNKNEIGVNYDHNTLVLNEWGMLSQAIPSGTYNSITLFDNIDNSFVPSSVDNLYKLHDKIIPKAGDMIELRAKGNHLFHYILDHVNTDFFDLKATVVESNYEDYDALAEFMILKQDNGEYVIDIADFNTRYDFPFSGSNYANGGYYRFTNDASFKGLKALFAYFSKNNV